MKTGFIRTIFSLYCIMIITCASLPCQAQEEHHAPGHDTGLSMQSISLFKNGLGFFKGKIKLPEKETKLVIRDIPPAAHGAFWLNHSPEVELKRVISDIESKTERRPVKDLGALLQKNPGREVVLSTGMEEKNTIRGILVNIPVARPAAAGESTLLDISNPSPAYIPRLSSSAGGTGSDLIMLETSDGVTVLKSGMINRVDFNHSQIETHAETATQHSCIIIELENPAPDQEIDVAFLAKGISWAPSYLIDLSQPENALFTAKAVVINEAMNLTSVELNLISGYPNIKFSDVTSPLSMKGSLAEFINSLNNLDDQYGRSGMRSQAAYVLNQSALMSYAEGDAADFSTKMKGQVSEDLYLYPVDDFSLLKGKRAYLPLFSSEMPYKHIYTWKIKDYLDQEERYQYESSRPDGKREEEIWHSCRLVNQLEMPLTTAPAAFIKNGSFTGQDVCYYTAPGAETTIRINRAMNILAEQAEFEVERKRDAQRIHGWTYDLVRIRGECKIRSRLDKTADIEITKELSGEVLDTSLEAEDLKINKGLKQVNPKHRLIWELSLKPGEEKILTYIYQAFIRN